MHWNWQRQILIILAILISNSFACKSSNLRAGKAAPLEEDTSQLSRSNTRPSEDNGGLPGYPLICQVGERSSTETILNCQMTTKDGNRIELYEYFQSWDFKFNSSSEALSAELQLPSEPYHVSWSVRYSANTAVGNDLELSVIQLVAVTQAGDQENMAWKLGDTISPNWESQHFPSFRLLVHSIETTEFIDPSACITYLQLSSSGRWLEPSYNDTESTFVLGNYSVTVSASSHEEFAIEAFIPEGFWESDPGTYDNEAPFEALRSDPSWVEVNFQDSWLRVDGLRILGTPLGFYDAGECSPNVISLLGSQDGIEWQQIPNVNRLPIQSVPTFEIRW